ncbi:7272_t:CDS:2 [Entrophospora sp. SA101]|nr:7272_t:CDS:2 [Entrophospora sp. SA101]
MGSFVENTPTAVWQHIGILSKYTDCKNIYHEEYNDKELFPKDSQK